MQQLLIIGAGEAGKIIAEELSHQKGATLLGFLDDNPALHGKRFRGASVLGPISLLPGLTKANAVSEVIVAIPSASGETLAPIIELLRQCRLSYRITPGYYNCETNEIDIRYPLRPVNIADLLGRHTVNLPLKKLSGYLEGRRVLVTGAGGSIGSEIARLSCMFHPESVILLGRGEGSVFDIQSELKIRFPKIKTSAVIANCTDRENLMRHFSLWKPHIVFHAAAHKHVPFMEADPREAFRNNVMGSMHTFDAACEAGVNNLVLLSTDKAVQPKSVMGLTKRLLEILIQNDYRKSPTSFCAVRFGNVLGSRGSVVELFQRQIEAGGPLTVTHPKAKRYFMTIPEAAQLVLVAGAISKPGHVYVLHMGRQISILKLARDLIRLHGLLPEENMKIRFVGMRPGEKLKESTLLHPQLSKTLHQKIWEEPPPAARTPIKTKLLGLQSSLDKISEKELIGALQKLC